MGLGVDDVIGTDHPFLINNYDRLKVIQHEEPGEEESRTPEGRRNPGVQVIIIRRRRIVSDHRWTFIIVVVVDHVRIGVITIILWRSRLAALISGYYHWKPKIHGNTLHRIYCFIPIH
jgi:hypothetical protein